ncbi:hypothetical protein Mrad2831_6344 (plasmid) [Methylobacterium radiotolerans JCM 2831]|uniref:Uncharacterized protein n=1 Tax=Methylobacterium radiotolerans (strain ATCC 27329 / DSM 1819 / JCM 2831 / NBRC 15690 / NCIMB 10815 / 0-1) TaxID=426355 RepID=B1M9U1_METRJ|nr:hypothetical protein [Xanthomonas axonopodis]ACB28266.1 hypothetical protein Mrad2831_6344 [Methylobacterium radiotolerans JCM 2831]PPV09348.1 hypothetical protein XavaCFBP5823_15325 [Xanthomonas axonopodis pv. vasculorum]RTE56210.1 hypothetical protein EI541_20030 [Xanthomonas axonopodis pv. eucalyptorum]RWU13143.1 hypothetical protein XANMN_22700 [Xanthomonas phaseoli pv. manihotis str. CIO151]
MGAVRSILVDGVPIADAATAHQITAKHARVLMNRFLAKAEQQRLAEFMQVEPPKQPTALLESYANEIVTLRDKGYTADQIAAYLKKHGVATSAAKVRNFIRSNRA